MSWTALTVFLAELVDSILNKLMAWILPRDIWGSIQTLRNGFSA